MVMESHDMEILLNVSALVSLKIAAHFFLKFGKLLHEKLKDFKEMKN